MKVTPLQTRVVQPPKDDLFAVLKEALPAVKERTIVAVTSKIVSIGEGHCVKKEYVASKDDLAAQEAERYLPRGTGMKWRVMHTVTRGSLMSSAGIDESNGDGHYILLPQDPMQSAENIRDWAVETYGIRNVGVIITDSHSKPLHQGSIGQAIGYAGFKPIIDYRKVSDLFNRSFHASRFNLADSLAASAVVVMGEGSECTPLALITDCPSVAFVDKYKPKDQFVEFFVKPENDIFKPFFSLPGWKKKQK